MPAIETSSPRPVADDRADYMTSPVGSLDQLTHGLGISWGSVARHARDPRLSSPVSAPVPNTWRNASRAITKLGERCMACKRRSRSRSACPPNCRKAGFVSRAVAFNNSPCHQKRTLTTKKAPATGRPLACSQDANKLRILFGACSKTDREYSVIML